MSLRSLRYGRTRRPGLVLAATAVVAATLSAGPLRTPGAGAAPPPPSHADVAALVRVPSTAALSYSGARFDPAGRLYAVRSDNRIVRFDDNGNGTVTEVVVAGDGTAGYTDATGPALTLPFNSLNHGLAFRPGTTQLYISDQGHLRVLDTATGIISTQPGSNLIVAYHLAFESSGQYLFLGQHGPSPTGYANFIDRFDVAAGTLTRLYGTGATTSSGDDGPASAASFDAIGFAVVGSGGSPLIYLADATNGRIRKITSGAAATITTIAGVGFIPTPGSQVEGVPATSRWIGAPADIGLRADGKLIIPSVSTQMVFELDPNTNSIRRIAGKDHTAALTTTNGENGPATEADVILPSSVAISPTTGAVVLTECGSAVNTGCVNLPARRVLTLVEATAPVIAGLSATVLPGANYAPLQAIPPSVIPVSAANIGSATLGQTNLREPLKGTQPAPLSSIPLSSIPLSSIPLSSIPLSSIPLSSIPLSSIDVPGGWADLLVATPWATWPLQSVSLQLLLGPANPHTSPTDPRNPRNLKLSSLDLSGTPLSSIPLSSIALGDKPVKDLPLPAVPGKTNVQVWCDAVTSAGGDCVALGLNSPGSTTSLVSIALAGVPLSSIPLDAIPLSSIDLTGTPLSSIPLSSIDLVGTPLSSIPLSSITIGATPLSSIPLSSIANITTIVDCTLIGGCTGKLLGDLPPSELAKLSLGVLPTVNGMTIGQLGAALVAPSTATLGMVLGLLFPRTQLPWETLTLDDPLPLNVAGQAPGGGAPAGAPIRPVVYSPVIRGFGVHVVQDIDVEVTLPIGWNIPTNVANLSRNGGPSTPIPLPTRTDRTFTYPISAFTGSTANSSALLLAFQHGATLSTQYPEIRLRGSALGFSVSSVGETTVSGSWEEPNDTLATARPIQKDIAYFPHIDTRSDVDLYSITVPSGGVEVSAILSNLHADFDLTLYGPALPAGRHVTTVEDQIAGLAGEQTSAGANRGNDQPLLDLPVVSSHHRLGLGDERIDTQPLAPGNYTLAVTGYNGASSPEPYALRVAFTATAPPPPCESRTWPGGAPSATDRGALPSAGSYAGVNTVLLVNRARLLAAYPSDAPGALTALDEFVAATTANPALGVSAVVVAIDGDPNVWNAYQAWDSGANRCETALANGVNDAVRSLLATVRSAAPGLANIVVVGGDDQIPFRRIDDGTTIANERSYAVDFSGNNEYVAALRGGKVLTDDAYGSTTPIYAGPRELFRPDLAVGRLVESPAEITSALRDFVANEGHLDASSSLSTGYDFLRDGANEVKAALTANGLAPVPAPAGPELIGQTWSKATLASALLGVTVPDVASVNAHFNNREALPADKGPLFDLADIAAAGPRKLARSLLFSMGCHSGTSVADSAAVAARRSDWAQAMAAQGAIWIGNTGYGYGDTDVVAASEALMAAFARNLDGSTTTGQAMRNAKLRYLADVAVDGDLAVLTPYDEKVTQQVAFYGLPMYRLRATLAPPVAAPAPRPLTVDGRTGLQTASFDETPSLTPVVTGRGTFWSSDSGAVAVQYRPLEPRSTRDATQRDGAGTLTAEARGAIVTALTSTDQPSVDPVIYTPVVDETAPGFETKAADSVFPSKFVGIGTYRDGLGARQQVVLIPGQFEAAATGTLGVQRLFSRMAGVVYYADPAATDRDAPIILRTQGAIAAGAAAFTVSAQDRAGAGEVKRVYVLATNADSPGTWFGTDLVRIPGTEQWTGGMGLPGGTGAIEYLVQAVDGSGNVATSSNKGVDFSGRGLSAPEPGAPVLTFGTPVPPSGWFGAAGTTVTVTDPASLPFGVSIDGGPYASVVGPVQISGLGIHTVTAKNSAGKMSSILVPVDDAGPIVVATPNAQKTSVTFAVDDPGGSGVATIVWSVNGSPGSSASSPVEVPLPGSANAVVTFSAVDRAGNAGPPGEITVTRADTAAPVISCAAPPTGWLGDNAQVACTASDAGPNASGLANAADAAFHLATTVPVLTEEISAQSDTRQVCDVAGNCASAGPIGPIQVDRRAPNASVTAPVSGAEYTIGQVVLASYSCTDAGSGLAPTPTACTGTVATGSAIDTATAGSKSFVVSTLDAVGNAATSTLTYTVNPATPIGPIVKADYDVGVRSVAFQTTGVVIWGSFTSSTPAPFAAAVQWRTGGPFTPFAVADSTRFVAAFVYPAAGTYTAVVRICDRANRCGTDTVTLRVGVNDRLTPVLQCVSDRGPSVNPRYEARFGHDNPGVTPIVVPVPLNNAFAPLPADRGQPRVFLPGQHREIFTVAFNSGTITWLLDGRTAIARTTTKPRC